MFGRRLGSIGVTALLAVVVGCAAPGQDDVDAERPLRLGFEDVPAPAAFEIEGPAVRDRAQGAAGLWAVVPGLPRPERAQVVNLETGDKVVVALFSGRAGSGIRISNAAADALEIAEGPARVRVTALRTRPLIDTTKGRF